MLSLVMIAALGQLPAPQGTPQTFMAPPTKSAPPVMLPPTKSAPPVLMPPAKGTPQVTTTYGAPQGGYYGVGVGVAEDEYKYKARYHESNKPRKGFHPFKKVFHKGGASVGVGSCSGPSCRG